jgi:hypothetical protein
VTREHDRLGAAREELAAMYQPGSLDRLPLWALFLATLALVLFSVETGYRPGRRRQRQTPTEKESSVGAMVGATLGLLAFILAFTFGLAANRFEARRQVIVDEANAIGTTFLRAALLTEPERTEARRLLRQYTEVRIKGVRPDLLEQAVSESTGLHARLCAQAVAAGAKDARSVPTGLFIQSLSVLIDTHSKRILIGVRNRIPAALWGALFFIALLSMAQLGYHEGLTSPRRSPAALALVLTFSAVMILIADLDRRSEGLLRVSQQSMLDLRESLEHFSF